MVAARTGADKHRGLSLLVLERGMDGFERGKQIDKLGQHASDTSELFFDDVHVPAEDLLGAEGSGFLQLVSRLVPERLILAVSSIAGCEAAFAMTLDYIKERTAFGKPVGSFQNSRFVMAEMKTKIEITRCFVDRCIVRTSRVRARPRRPRWRSGGRRSCSAMSRTQACSCTAATATRTEYPIGKAWVDARVSRIYAGTNEIMKELIGRTIGL